MKERKKTCLMSKKTIKKEILKYSNIHLFEKRERNYSSEKTSNFKTQVTYKINKIIKKNKKMNLTNETNLAPFHQTMTSFYSLDKSSSVLPLLDLDYFKTSNSKNKLRKQKTHLFKKNNNILNKTDNKNKTSINFYLTGTPEIRKTKKLTYFIDNEKDNKNNNNEIKKDIDIETLIQIKNASNQNHIFNKISNQLKLKKRMKGFSEHNSYIKTDINSNNLESTLEEQERNSIINTKISKYNHYKNPGINDFIEKTQDLKLNSYTSNIKKERIIRLEEGYYNQIEFYQDTINSLQFAKKLLEVNFVNKIADYTRFLMSKREREIVKNSNLLQEIITHRKDIDRVNNKIKKIEMEKNNIIRWIYFQLQIKEKKLVLPTQYITIIENWGQKRVSLRKSTRRDDLKDRSKSRKKSIRRPSYYQFDSFGFGNKESNSSSISSAANEKRDDLKDYRNIYNYRSNLIFKTPEDFQEALANLEKEDINLIYYNNDLNEELFELKKELELTMKMKDSIEEFNKLLLSKQRQLNNLKILVEKKTQLIATIKKSEDKLIDLSKEKDYKRAICLKKDRKGNIDDKKTNIADSSTSNELSVEKKNNLIDKNKLLLYKKINVIFEGCKIVNNKLRYSYFIIHLVTKKIISKEKEMLLKLEFIEQSIDYLISKFNFYLNKDEESKELIKKIKNDIEKEHKMNKAKIQKMIDLERIKLLKEKVEKKSNKIYFLKSRKLDLYKFKLNKEKKMVDNDANRIPTIQDYLYDEK